MPVSPSFLIPFTLSEMGFPMELCGVLGSVTAMCPAKSCPHLKARARKQARKPQPCSSCSFDRKAQKHIKRYSTCRRIVTSACCALLPDHVQLSRDLRLHLTTCAILFNSVYFATVVEFISRKICYNILYPIDNVICIWYGRPQWGWKE